MSASGRVAVVTGASRGAGRGIAVALGAHGWRVYVTGRSIADSGTAELVSAAGGVGVAVPVDHADDDAVARLFARVRDEDGGLDLLVNNAAVIHDELTGAKPFWEKPVELGDVLDVGLRSAYVASWHAAPLLITRPRALIAFTSSPGSVCYMHGPPCMSVCRMGVSSCYAPPFSTKAHVTASRTRKAQALSLFG
ncbi:SDR family NAD(P)-dependent oxidoreductase [Mycobacterium sp. Root265]|uniref:SDR family NAD(P)-dependent oxidoreductase n=1 Tax=Mycobacterium sp. Root265 TaxID=1736504 RepID=UPI0009E6A40F|nr:SDR family NAD(P)-dependent oxidoreductase [Mycobacterium sp. Root265]